MRHEFVNEQPVPINSGPPSTIQTMIDVTGLNGATVQEVEVTLDITHSWTGDLVIKLRGPDGTEVVLVDREGGSRNHFRNTTFRANASTSITTGRAPFRGAFRPEGDLSGFNGTPAEGIWTLVVEDKANQDGGALNRWSLGLTSNAVAPSAFQVQIRFLGGLSPNQQAAFAEAAARWSQIIIGDVPPVLLNGEEIDDVLIEAQGVPIDGPGKVLGQAGPTHIRPVSNLPIRGIMSFDTADLNQMEDNGSLGDVILHEMGHVLGFGTLWTDTFMNLILGEGTVNPIFVGANAMAEYAVLTGRDTATPVPVANTGGPGTRDGHWREAVFGDELLTGFLSGAVRSISRVSVACFEDMGYQVDYDAADAFDLPSQLRLAEIGLMGDRNEADTCCGVERIRPVVVPAATMINRPA
jgi:subtilisin-like proprotein convertase family protein